MVVAFVVSVFVVPMVVEVSMFVMVISVRMVPVALVAFTGGGNRRAAARVVGGW